MPVPRVLRRLPAVALAAASLSAAAVSASAGAVGHATMTVTKSGKITKLDSKSSFNVKVGSKTYVVHTDAMTHVTVDGKSSKVSALKVGESVSVKGTLEMDTITATTVTEGM